MIMPIKINSACIIISFVLWLFVKEFVHIKYLFYNDLAKAFYIFYFIHVVSILYSENLPYALNSVFERKISYILLPVMLINKERILGLKYLLFRVFYLSTTFAILYCTYSSFHDLLFMESEINIFEKFSYKSFSSHIEIQPIYFSFLVIISFLLILRDIFFNFNLEFIPNKKVYVLCISIFMLIIHYFSIIFLSSRTEIIAFLVFVFLFIFSLAKRKNFFFRGIILISVISAISFFFIIINDINRERFSEMIDFKSDYTSDKWGGRSFRLYKWKYSLELWEKNIFFGTGIGDFQIELNKIYDQYRFSMALDGNYNSHNQYIQTLATLGIPGLIALVYIYLILIKSYRNHGDWVILAFSIVCLISMLTESMLERNKGLIPFVFFSIVLHTYSEKFERIVSRKIV
jgi:O-antigen ligase